MFPHLFSRAGFLATLISALLPLAAVGQGLQMSLITSGTTFKVTDPPPAGSALTLRRAYQAQRVSIAASATLTNYGRSDLPIYYDHAGAAANRFQFTVLNSAGAAVWASESYVTTSGVNETAADQVLLKSRASLRRTVQIPLNVGNSWLPTGRYTLVASTGARGPQATSIFDVISPVPATDTGIRGTVRTYQSGANSIPVQNTVIITEVRAPGDRSTKPLFTGTAFPDAQGQFQLLTPPGTYLVSAPPLGFIPEASTFPIPIGSPQSGMQLFGYGVAPIGDTTFYLDFTSLNPRTVQVIPGHFTTCNFTLPGLPNPVRNYIPILRSAKLINYVTTNSIPGSVSFQVKAVGTAQNGGYSNPRLVLRPTDPAHPEIRAYDFLIDPPGPNMIYTAAFTNHTARAFASFGGPNAPVPTIVRVYGGDTFLDAEMSVDSE